MDVFLDVLNVPDNVGVIVISDTVLPEPCPDCPDCPDPQHIERLVLRDVKAGDRLGKPADVEFFCLDSLIIESVVCPECPECPESPDCDTIPEPPVDNTEKDGKP